MNNRRRVTVFAPSLEPGGAERVIVNLVNGFVDDNVRVDLIVATRHISLLNKVKKETNIIQFNHERTIFSLFSLIKYLKHNKSTILLSHIANANRIAILANILSGKNSKVHVVEHTTHSLSLNNMSGIIRMLTNIVYRILYPKADMVIHVSQEAASDLERKYNWEQGRVKVAFNPIINEQLVSHTNNGTVHTWFGPGQPPVILGAGRLISDKNFSLLIDAFSKVRRQIDSRLIILGEGPERPLLEKKISGLNLQEDVALAGYVDNPFDYMKQASVFVLSSKREGLPSVLIEALACGVPVVSTKCPSGPAEILEFGKYGELVPLDAPDEMANAIIRAVKNPPKSEVNIERAKNFTIERSVKRYIELLNIDEPVQEPDG